MVIVMDRVFYLLRKAVLILYMYVDLPETELPYLKNCKNIIISILHFLINLLK